MKQKVQLSIGRVSDGTIRLTVEDTRAAITFLEVTLTPAQFGEMITGLVTNGIAEIRGLDQIGKRFEHKSEQVWCRFGAALNEMTRLKRAQAAVKPYEIDGWAGDAADALNPHHYIRSDPALGDLYRVRFFRRVEDKGE